MSTKSKNKNGHGSKDATHVALQLHPNGDEYQKLDKKQCNAWNYLSHDQARSWAYRWGEDGLAGTFR
jgi:hypothetical protein